MKLYYVQGSPFARMARVAIREYGLSCEECLIEEFPPPPDYFAINPLGQVPALEDGPRTYFPTRSVLERLARRAAQEASADTELASQLWRPERLEEDLQVFTVLLALGDILVSIQYQ